MSKNKDFGPLGPDLNLKTPFNYFIKLRDTFKDGSRSVDYLMRLVDPKTKEKIGLVHVLIFQFILLESINSFGYLCDVLGNREDPKSIKYIPISIDVLVHRFKGYFTRKEIQDAITNLVMLNKLEFSEEYNCYRVVDFLKHCGKEIDYIEYRKGQAQK